MDIGWERVTLKGAASFRLAEIVAKLRWHDEQTHLDFLFLFSRESAEEFSIERIGSLTENEGSRVRRVAMRQLQK